jgi:DNA-binding response OmpR family regulator
MDDVDVLNIARARAQRDTSIPRGGAKPLRILLVEDHADTAWALVHLMRRYGYEVHHASDIDSARRMAKEQPFDLLISDITLPDGSGLDLIALLSATLANGRVCGIALSGCGTDDDLEKTRSAGYVEHLIKPVGIEQLLSAIDRAVSTTRTRS